MTIKYVGNRGNLHHGIRMAEFTYTEREAERFLRIVDKLKAMGWKVDTGVECWAAIVVEDRAEFNNVKADYKEIKRTTR